MTHSSENSPHFCKSGWRIIFPTRVGGFSSSSVTGLCRHARYQKYSSLDASLNRRGCVCLEQMLSAMWQGEGRLGLIMLLTPRVLGSEPTLSHPPPCGSCFAVSPARGGSGDSWPVSLSEDSSQSRATSRSRPPRAPPLDAFFDSD